jgi:hypothetical protein
MALRKQVFIFFLLIVFTMPAALANKRDSLLTVLDRALDNYSEYDSKKEERLSFLKNELHRCSSKEVLHDAYYKLYKEYEAYIFDSAVYYAQVHLSVAELENNSYWINECKMQLSRMYSIYARFPESLNILNSIDKSKLGATQLGGYYNSFSEVYIYWAEYTDGAEKWKYNEIKNRYQDSALTVIPKGSYHFDINYGRKCMEQKDFEQAKKSLFPYLSKMEKDTRDYAILTSLIAYGYELEGKPELQKEYLAISATADVRASVKENVSIGFLAQYLLNEGDVARSNRYIKKSLEDANFYNARLRNIQIAKILPVIDKAYQLQREEYQKKLLTAIAFICILLLFLSALVFYLIQQMRKLSKTRRKLIDANSELKDVNRRLVENNHIKEEYIGRFLNQCSIYINKLEAYRKMLNRKAADGKTEELFSLLKSSQIIDDELKEFYHNFDVAFLNIFPDFVKQFNLLLSPENKVSPKHEGGLSAELRIFALIRLGITDSTKIAGFLRYSVTTIYNYRSKYRNKALGEPDDFEKNVMKIDSLLEL